MTPPAPAPAPAGRTPRASARNTYVRDKSWMLGKSRITMGAFSYGLKGLRILQWGEGAKLHLGRFCSIAANVTIFLGGNHRIDWATTYPFGALHVDVLGGAGIVGHPATRGDVRIGHDVWIGDGASILSGVSIGNGAVVAAGSMVTRDVPAYAVVAGNPAKLVSARFAPALVDRLQELRWWDLPTDALRTIAPLLSQAPDEALLDDLVARFRDAPRTAMS